MKPIDHIRRARHCLDSIEAKIGSHDKGPLRVALVDAIRLAESVTELVASVAARVGGER